MPRPRYAKPPLLDDRAPRWFERFRDPRSVLAVLGGPEQADEFETFGFGDDPSPLRHALRGFVAARAGDRELARRELEALLAGGVDVHFDAARRVLATLP
jgi:hypothetical protein